ncbi:hypothetical protein F2P79_001553 [Pimephales promelas]|nr:hypothetical protein F2P79_001553 [Pimephales promelas]
MLPRDRVVDIQDCCHSRSYYLPHLYPIKAVSYKIPEEKGTYPGVHIKTAEVPVIDGDRHFLIKQILDNLPDEYLHPALNHLPVSARREQRQPGGTAGPLYRPLAARQTVFGG